AGLEIVISDMELIRDLTVYIEDDCKYFEMNYCLAGETICEMNGQQFNIWEPKSHAYYADRTQAQLEFKANVRSMPLKFVYPPKHCSITLKMKEIKKAF